MAKQKLLKTSLAILGALLLNSKQIFAMIDASGKLFNHNDNSPVTSIIVKFNQNSSVKNLSMQGFSEYLNQKLNIDLQPVKKLSNGAILFEASAENNFTNNSTLTEKLSNLQKDPNIKYAEINSYLYLQKTPNDSRFAEQWHYFNKQGGINLPSAWEITTGSSKIVVGVIDSGVVEHEDLKQNLLRGRNFVDDDNALDDPTDHGGKTSYHGTHVAGTIGAVTNNYGIVAGVNWNAKILPARVLDDSGRGATSEIIEGMRWAAGISYIFNPTPAKVLNLSISGFGKCKESMQETIDEIVANGTIIVVAAGNSNLKAKHFTPANCKNVITVGASNLQGEKAYYSNFGADTIDIVAPGGDIRKGPEGGVLSLAAPGKVQFLQGTSMAAPHIAGLVALMLSINPYLDTEQIINYMQQNVKNDTMGVGLVDANKVLSKLLSDYNNQLRVE